MEQTIKLLKEPFISSSVTTPQFLAFYKTFKKEFTDFLTQRKCTQIEIGKGHFYISGFFTSHTGQVYYFNFGDVRIDGSGRFYYRTATDYKDFTGGHNIWAYLDKINEMVI